MPWSCCTCLKNEQELSTLSNVWLPSQLSAGHSANGGRMPGTAVRNGDLTFATDLFKATEDSDEYLAANVFWVSPEARWASLQAKAKTPEIGKLIEDTMHTIENVPSNAKLKGALPRGYARPALNKVIISACTTSLIERDGGKLTDIAVYGQ